MTNGRKPWDIPPLYFVITLAIMFAIASAPGSQFIYYPYQYLGVVFVVGGLALAAAALRQFARAGTTRHPHDQPTAFVTTGPYRFTRNPMYTGLFLVLFGAAFLLQR